LANFEKKSSAGPIFDSFPPKAIAAAKTPLSACAALPTLPILTL